MRNLTETERNAAERTLREAAEAYYNDTPVMSDAEYDTLWRKHEQSRQESPEDPFWQDTILDKVGAAPAKKSGFAKVRHEVPMLSLDNVFVGEDGNLEELHAWFRKVQQTLGRPARITAEPKVDGLALSVIYKGGKLLRAVTRGDKTTGDDVTENVKAAGLVPWELKDYLGTAGTVAEDLELRGEVCMEFSAFEQLNARLKAAGEEEFSNPRNAASGILRRKDPRLVAGQGLTFIAHGCRGAVTGGDLSYSYAHDSYRLLVLGFKFPQVRVFSTAGEDATCAVELWEELAKQPYPTDGVVFKVDYYEDRQTLGEGTRAPKWAVALKLKQARAVTRLKAITVQVGRSGILTPVAELHPVELDGSIISRATLHNEDQIRRLELVIGDDVEIQKMGAIIPGILRSVSADYRRRELTRYYASRYPELPDMIRCAQVEELMGCERAPFNLIAHIGGKCPSCGGADIQKQQVAGEDGARYQCMNAACPAQLAARIEHFCFRQCLDIEGIGSEAAGAIAKHFGDRSLATKLFTAGWPPELLMLALFGNPKSWWESLSWATESGGTMTLGRLRADKVMAALARAKTLPLHRWLFALGIPSIGENTSKEISRLFSSARDLTVLCGRGGIDRCHVAADALLRITEGEDKNSDRLKRLAISSHLGPVSCKALLTFARSDVGLAAFSRLAEWNIKSDNYNPIPEATDDKPLFGKTFAITGTLSVGRDAMKALIESKGGKVTGSVSAKTDYLVAGEGGGQKAEKARAAGVQILDEAALRALW